MARTPQPRRERDPSFDDLIASDLKKKSYRPVYCLVGDDAFRAESVVAHIKEDVLGQGSADFNYHVHRGEQVNLETVLQQAVSYPMLGSHQLIWVRDAEHCLGEAQAEAALARYLKQPVASTILIFTCGKTDRRRRWLKIFQQQHCLFDFSPPKGTQLVSWVRKAAKRAGIPLSGTLPELLIELVGEDLHALTAEIDKLSLLAQEQTPALTRSQIEEVIMEQRLLDAFEILKHLRPGDPGPALVVWRRLSAWGKSAHEVAPLLAWRIRQACLVDALQAEAKQTGDQRETAIGLSPWVLRQATDTARILGPAGLRRALAACLRCDQALKRSPLKEDLILERAIFEICALQDTDGILSE